MFSTYYYELEETAKQRYRQTLNKAGLVDDPYVTQEQRIQSEDWQNWPRVEFPDIYIQLSYSTPSVYTGESLRAYKSLDGYTPDIKLVFGSVKHSQRISATPLKPWVAARKEGIVVCAHCTCMAGLGEACSHIVALLFMLEKNTQHQNMTTCTSLPYSWLPPSYQAVTYSAIADIDFATPQLKEEKLLVVL